MNAKMKMGLALAFTSLAVGCSSGNANGPAASGSAAPSAAPPEPVTLYLYPGQWITEADMETLINGPLQRKYPHITVEIIPRDNNSLANHLTTGAPVDLITSWNGSMANNMDLQIYEDLTPLAQKLNFSFTKFDAAALDTVRTISDDGKLYGLPYNRQFNALYYNKDIFDKFGVPYPKDGMTWEETIELARRVTRQEDGVNYRGLDPENITRMGFQLSTGIVDASKEQSIISEKLDTYKKLFENGYNIFSINGNKPPKWGYSAYDAFIKDRTVAMSAMINMFPYLAQAPEFTNWDIAQYPSYPDNPNVYGMFDMHIIGISNTSKHKDEAMKVLEVLFSDEVQMASVEQTGRVSLLSDKKFQDAFGKNMSILQGKNLDAIFKSKPAPAPKLSKYYSKAGGILRAKFYEYADGKMDVITALREAEEEINGHIKGEEGK